MQGSGVGLHVLKMLNGDINAVPGGQEILLLTHANRWQGGLAGVICKLKQTCLAWCPLTL